MKTEFSTDIPQFDAILAETGEEKFFIEDCLNSVSSMPLEDFFQLMEELSDISVDTEVAESPDRTCRDMIEAAQSAAKQIASEYFQVDIRKEISPDVFYFFDGGIFDGCSRKMSFYSIFPGKVFMSKQESEAVQLLEIFRQVWNFSSYSWIAFDGSDFPCRSGLSCSIPSRGDQYFSQINDSLNSYATYIFYQRFASSIPWFEEPGGKGGNLIRYIFSSKDYDVFGRIFERINHSNSERDPLTIMKDFHRAKLNGDMFDVRGYCKNAYGPKGLKKLGELTSLSEQ
ncbi:MAG: hypothetical protein PHW52_00710 [Candidatus Pacebacteria bacterium]|nr:hypothetical protein [Candidatus Paceibacterota bacterium]